MTEYRGMSLATQLDNIRSAEKEQEAQKEGARQAVINERGQHRIDVLVRTARLLDVSIERDSVTLRSPPNNRENPIAVVTIDGIMLGVSGYSGAGPVDLNNSLHVVKKCATCDAWLMTGGIQLHAGLDRGALLKSILWHCDNGSCYLLGNRDSSHGVNNCQWRGFKLVDLRSGAEKILDSRSDNDALKEALRSLGYEVRATSLSQAPKEFQ